MLRDEQEADAFRQLRLIERYWEVWETRLPMDYGRLITVILLFAHIRAQTTNNQIQDARDNLVMRRTLQVWSSRLDAYRRTCQTANARADKTPDEEGFFPLETQSCWQTK